MKCPHCGVKVSLFSKEMNRMGQAKECPHCGKPVKLNMRYGVFGGVFAAVVIGGHLLGMGGTLAAACAGGIAALACMNLVAAES